MKKALWLILFIACVTELMAGRRPDRKFMIEQMVLVNERFMARHPVAGDSIRINGVRPSNIWTRSVYMEGLLALNEVAPQPRYVEYAMDWAVANLWGFRGGSHTRNADNQCCAQVYIDLYRLHEDAQVLGNTERGEQYGTRGLVVDRCLANGHARLCQNGRSQAGHSLFPYDEGTVWLYARLCRTGRTV